MTLFRAPIRAVLLLAACAALAQTPNQTPNQTPGQTSGQTSSQISGPPESPGPARPQRDPAIPPDVVTTPKPRPKPARTPGQDFNANVIVLDPAHGGADDGAHFASGLLEKNITVALADRLRPLLESRGFTVIETHSTADDDVPPDNRVEIANRSHAVACIILHATNGGHGVHLFMSALPPTSAPEGDPHAIQPWDVAQAAVLARSTRLESDLATGLNGLRVPLVNQKVSVRPIDAMSCPAVALEIAPIDAGDLHTSVADANYQQRVAEAAAEALTLWRSHALAMALSAEIAHAAESAKQAAALPGADTIKPAARPKPRPKPIAPVQNYPEEAPPGDAIRKPAPVVRRPPPPSSAQPAPPQTEERP